MSNWTGPTNPVESLYWHYLGKPNESEWNEKKFPKGVKTRVGSGRNNFTVHIGKVYNFSFFDKTNDDEEYDIQAYWTGVTTPQGSMMLVEATVNNPDTYYVFPDEFLNVREIKLDKDEVIVESTVYVLVKVSMSHRKGDEPEQVVNECDYNIKFNGPEAVITDTEMVEVYDKHPDSK